MPFINSIFTPEEEEAERVQSLPNKSDKERRGGGISQ